MQFYGGPKLSFLSSVVFVRKQQEGELWQALKHHVCEHI